MKSSDLFMNNLRLCPVPADMKSGSYFGTIP